MQQGLSADWGDEKTVFQNFLKNQAQNEFTEFATFLSSLVVRIYKRGRALRQSSRQLYFFDKLSGLSLYLLETEKDISRHDSFALYQRVNLGSL
jgi:hypothetical protein